MNQHFRLKYNEMRENIPSPPDDASVKDESYASYSNVRNVCFVLADGNIIFLNYGYLVAGRFFPADNRIILSFTSDTVILTGIHLEALFYDLMQQIPRQIVCSDSRYNVTADDGPVVNDIKVKSNAQ